MLGKRILSRKGEGEGYLDIGRTISSNTRLAKEYLERLRKEDDIGAASSEDEADRYMETGEKLSRERLERQGKLFRSSLVESLLFLKFTGNSRLDLKCAN